MKKTIILSMFGPVIIAGCSIHPLPEDVTRDTTSTIVKKIRCEGRQALDNITVDLLKSDGNDSDAQYARQIELGTLKATDLLRYREKYPLHLSSTDTDKFMSYTLSAVTFDFQFMISETNENSTNFDLAFPFTSRVFDVAGSADGKLQRQNTRKFLVTNSFFELHDIPKHDCDGLTAVVGNVFYPITGKIGLEEVFRTFVDIDSTAGSTKKPDDTHLFTDSLLFTTTVTASLTPKITLNPVTGPSQVLRVPSAAATASATRVDAHQVAISIARGDRLVSYEQAVKASTPYFLAALDKGREGAKRKSVAIAAQNRVNFFFINQQTINSRLNIVNPYAY